MFIMESVGNKYKQKEVTKNYPKILKKSCPLLTFWCIFFQALCT